MAKYPGLRPVYSGNDDDFGKYYSGSNKAKQIQRKSKLLKNDSELQLVESRIPSSSKVNLVRFTTNSGSKDSI